MMIQKNDVVQFTEKHKWCGCLGVVTEVRKTGSGRRYMVGVPMPSNDGNIPTAYIFDNGDNLERIGVAALIAKGDDDD